MKAVVKQRPEPGLVLMDVGMPKIGEGEVLVKVKATSICGTDLHIYNWNEWAQSRIHPPRIVGHEFAGEVVETGATVSKITNGDLVSAESHIACGTCYQCKVGNKHICERGKILGVDVDGSFAEYVSIPEENAWKVRDTIPLEHASLMEPLGNAVYATLVTQIPGNSVAIFGCGPAGLAAIAVAKSAGAAQILAVDVNEFRVNLAKKVGASLGINASQSDPVQSIKDHTSGRGADIVMEMSGSPVAVRQAFRALRNRGRLTLFGLPAKPVELNLAEDIIFKEARVYGSVGREMFRTWYRTQALLNSGRIDVTSLITHRMRMAQFEEALQLMKTGNCGKIILTP